MRAAQLRGLVAGAALAALLIAPASAKPPTPQPVKHVVSSAEAPAHLIAGGKGVAQLFLNPETGSTRAALSVLTLAPGAAVPPHVHPDSDEILYIEVGRVEMVIAGETVTAKAGDAVHIPAGVEHSARTLGQVRALRAVQIYVAPGPEARFRKAPKTRPE